MGGGLKWPGRYIEPKGVHGVHLSDADDDEYDKKLKVGTANIVDWLKECRKYEMCLISVDRDLFIMNLLGRYSANWKIALEPHISVDGDRCWKYDGCKSWVFSCLQHWIRDQKFPSDDLVPESACPRNSDSDSEDRVNPACVMAIELFFVASDFYMQKLMDEAILVLQDHARRGTIMPSRDLVNRIFSNDRTVGQRVHFFCVDLFLVRGCWNTSAALRPIKELFKGDNAEVDLWHPGFLFFLFRRLGQRRITRTPWALF